MKKIVALMGIFALILTSCDNQSKVKEVKVGTTASIEVPVSLSDAKNLNDAAVFQMENGPQELYVIVIESEKAEYLDLVKESTGIMAEAFTSDLKGYSELVSSSILSNADLEADEELKQVTTNGLSTYVGTYQGMYEGVKVYYKLACVEGKDKYYQVLTWSLADKKEANLPAMTKMISSFKEI